MISSIIPGLGSLLRLGMGGGICDMTGLIIGGILATCAVCGLARCSGFRMRDCSCIKWCLRASGTDSFNDFDMMVLVHEALYTTNNRKLVTKVRITTGTQSVMTDPCKNGIFQQPLQIFVEQGTDKLVVDLLDARDRKVLATLKLDVMNDILKPKASESFEAEKSYPMKQKSKTLLNPRIKLSLHLSDEMDEEKSLLAGFGDDLSKHTDMHLRQHIAKAQKERRAAGPASTDEGPSELGRTEQEAEQEEEQLSEIDLLVKACAGPLDKFGSWGSKESVYVAVRGPPVVRKHAVGIWRCQSDFEKGLAPKLEIDLLKVLGVQPDPSRAEVFMINFVNRDKVKERLTLRRVDRARDVWVEMFHILIKMVREDSKKGAK